MKKYIFVVYLLLVTGLAAAQQETNLWLQPIRSVSPVNIDCSEQSPSLAIAKSELKKRWAGRPSATIQLRLVDDTLLKADGFRIGQNRIEARTDIGILYGVYALLRRQHTGEKIEANKTCNPSYQVRILNHWDNLDGTVERGYAGHSIFWRKGSLEVTATDKSLWSQYGRANASIGINGAVLNNVNASPLILSEKYLSRVRAIADVLRPYGVRVYLSVNFASPKTLGGLKTADPLDQSVISWWHNRIKEVYKLVPDFGGFLVKASSEGQPGPQDYGRTHADGANMLADGLKPYGGIVMWRAFVYSANDHDRAKQAYSEFVPLDGKFRDNVIIQVKNGPIDFQPREPFSPLFGAMRKTAVMPEFQITQEYLGHSTYLVFLGTMWEECLKSDTYQNGKGSTVARSTDGGIYPHKYTAIAGVANTGLDSNWTGNLFGQSNWYAFGRLAWNDTLASEQIADEWLKLTFGTPYFQKSKGEDKAKRWVKHFLNPVKNMMLTSREAAVNFMTPLGLHHIMSANGHYGPGPWWAPKGMRADWTPPYYHKADKDGIGFDRTMTGSGAVSQYHSPLDTVFNSLATCPERLLLWFHHVPWDYRMKNGRTLWEDLCYHYEKGVKQVAGFQAVWDGAKAYVDEADFIEMVHKLQAEYDNAVLWKDACLQYFQGINGLAFPHGITPPVHRLKDIMANEFKHKVD